MRNFILLFCLLNLFFTSCSSDSENNSSQNTNNNGFTVNNVFHSTPNFIVGPVTEKPQNGYDIYEFYFRNSNGNYVHIDVNSPNLNELELMTYQITQGGTRYPGKSDLGKNGYNFPEWNEWYYSTAGHFSNGFIKISKENGKLVFEYEFNYNDETKSIRGYAKQP